jgi:hypothetical protein
LVIGVPRPTYRFCFSIQVVEASAFGLENPEMSLLVVPVNADNVELEMKKEGRELILDRLVHDLNR